MKIFHHPQCQMFFFCESYLVIKVKSVGFNILFLDDLFMLLKGETCRNYSSVLKEDLGQTNNNEFEVHITNWVKI